MIEIPGGSFAMGSDRFYPEEKPVHRARVGSYWIDSHPVTNADLKGYRCPGHSEEIGLAAGHSGTARAWLADPG